MPKGVLYSGLYYISCPTAEDLFNVSNLDLTLSKDPYRDAFWATFRWGAWDGIMQMNPGPNADLKCSLGWRLRNLETGQLKFGKACQGNISFTGDGRLMGILYDIPGARNVEFDGWRVDEEAIQDDLQGEWDGFVKEAYRRSMSQSLVTINLDEGETPQSFMVHRDLICYHSWRFRRAFRGSSVESEHQSMRIRRIKSSTFRLFQMWLYGQAFRDTNPEPSEVLDGQFLTFRYPHAGSLPPVLNVYDNEHHYQVWVDLYAFADQYDVPQLRDDIMTVLIELEHYNEECLNVTTGDFKLDTVSFQLDSTLELHRYIVYRVKQDAHSQIEKGMLQHASREFLLDLHELRLGEDESKGYKIGTESQLRGV